MVSVSEDVVAGCLNELPELRVANAALSYCSAAAHRRLVLGLGG